MISGRSPVAADVPSAVVRSTARQRARVANGRSAGRRGRDARPAEPGAHRRGARSDAGRCWGAGRGWDAVPVRCHPGRGDHPGSGAGRATGRAGLDGRRSGDHPRDVGPAHDHRGCPRGRARHRHRRDSAASAPAGRPAAGGLNGRAPACGRGRVAARAADGVVSRRPAPYRGAPIGRWRGPAPGRAPPRPPRRIGSGRMRGSGSKPGMTSDGIDRPRTRSMSESSRSSSTQTSETAWPSTPARPVRPIRWT